METISQDTAERKSLKNPVFSSFNQWFPIAVIALVGVVSFGLGRLSVQEISQKSAVSIAQAASANEPAALYLGGLVVASKSGSKYHLPWCAGAQTIKPTNRVWFDSEEDARKAGYAPASNCAGLTGKSE